MIEVTMTDEEADAILELTVKEPAHSPLANVYKNVLNKRLADSNLWAHVNKHLIV